MSGFSIGDGVQHFLNSKHNVLLKTRLNVLSEELATGRVHDLERRLGGDRSRLAAVERNLTMLAGFEVAAAETGQALSMMQTSLDAVDDLRGDLAAHLLPINTGSSAGERAQAAIAARNSMGAIVQALNTRFADRSLFAGIETDGAALAPAEDMLNALAIAAAGAPDAATVVAVVNAWFDTPGGGFETSGYLGDSGAPIERRVDANHQIAIPARADDQAMRDVLKASALAALADGMVPLPADEVVLLMRASGEALLSSAQGLTEIQSRLGGAEGRLEEIRTGQTAQKTAFNLLRNEMITPDPYETASALQEAQLQLETHYTLTARLSRLSLTEYMR